MTAQPDLALTSIRIAHRVKFELAATGPMNATTWDVTYSLHTLHLPQEGPASEVLLCPTCGVPAFEVDRTEAVLTTWADCDAALQAWITAKLTPPPERWWEGPLFLGVFIASAAVFLFQIWRIVAFLQAGHAWAELWTSTEIGDTLVYGMASGLFGFVSSVAVFVLIFGKPSDPTPKIAPDALLWIARSSGAPIDRHPGLVYHIHRLSKYEGGDRVKAMHHYSPSGRRLDGYIDIKTIVSWRGRKIDWTFG